MNVERDAIRKAALAQLLVEHAGASIRRLGTMP
jgi:hypothetical protein